MFETLIIYLLIYTSSLICARQAQVATMSCNKPLYSSPFFYIGIVIFSLVVGLRWNVGTDYPAYYDLIMGFNTYDTSFDRLEFIPRCTINIIQKYNLPFYTWFILMAAIQMFFLQKTFSKELKIFVVWGMFFYLAGQLSLSMNIIRQATALTIVLYAYTHIAQKDYRKYTIWIIIASLFHTTALLGIPILFLKKVKFTISPLIQIGIVVFFYVFGEYLINYIVNSLSAYSNSIAYLSKTQSIEDNALIIKQGSGLGVIFNYTRYFILILYSKQLSQEYKKYGFDIFYTISFIGICLYKSTMYDMYLSRINMYFSIASIVCLSMLMVHLWEQKHNVIHQLIMIGLTLAQVGLLLYTIINGNSWSFVWDSHLY